MYLYSLLSLPVWLPQALWLKKNAVRLPEASGERQVISEGIEFCKVLILGDSVAAGVGVKTIEESLGGQVINQLQLQSSPEISWKVHAKSGDKLADLLSKLDAVSNEHWDLVVISIGVNDVTSFTSTHRWQQQLTELSSRLLKRSPDCKVIQLAIPDMGSFPLLKNPLSQIFSWRSKNLNRISMEFSKGHAQLTILPMDVELKAENFAEDGYHPSKRTCELIAQEILKLYKT